MKIKTSELIGKPLDYAVAKAEYLGIDSKWLLTFISAGVLKGYTPYSPSTNGSQGVDIIDREHISTLASGKHSSTSWWATCDNYGGTDSSIGETGSTLLIAAMRCYVASKLGDEVEIPQELL